MSQPPGAQPSDAAGSSEPKKRARAKKPAAPTPPNPSWDCFQTVFECSLLGQKIIAPDLTIRQANPAVVAMLGLSRPDELVGRRILEFAHPHYRADWHELEVRLWKHKMPNFRFETCLRRADGSSFYCQVTSILFPDEGGELGYTILEDITPRKELEDSLKRLYDAQETILHLAAHDLRTPLATIQLITELMQREAAAPPCPAGAPPETPKYLALIKRACAEAEALLQDVLYLGVLDANRLEKHRINLNAFLDAELRAHRVAAQEKGITLTLELPPEVLYARLHPDKFRRVMDNLLTNALKFTPVGGQVAVGLREHEGHIGLTVRDTGIGIPAKLQAHVFDKFNITARAGIHGEPTTGLGLFIAKQIVELHGGHIWLESREKEGTCFFIDLP
ncbi:PAS domain-containing sensor histidine kinase [Hymenobacter terricola]|uniref:PAS domain-containing sensor histidine kinase n=1 Tax=Hymenobacter terricola TaxID=2819236 RepID=UPI001B300D9C|nr:PAS domain-containing sensor histidine kinase [Hymenobacter terricola]